MTRELQIERLHGDSCTCTRCEGYQEGNRAAIRHGAFSERTVVPIIRNQRRRVLRQIGLRTGDLDPLGRAHLEMFCRATAKIVLIDRWIDEHGLIRPDGSVWPCMSIYVSLTNSARASLRALAGHLAERDPGFDFTAALAALSETA